MGNLFLVILMGIGRWVVRFGARFDEDEDE